MKILLCGPFPNPVGGVSVHLDRLAGFLAAEDGYDVDLCDESPCEKPNIYNIRTFRFGEYIRKVRCADIVHIHSSIHLARLLHLIVASIFGKKKIVTLHSWRAGDLATRMWRIAFGISNCEMIYVSALLGETIGLPGVISPAYINPRMNDQAVLPADLVDWISGAKNSMLKLVVSNAYRLVEYNAADLYGLDHCIEAASRLPEISFIFVVANCEGAEEIIASYQQKIIELGIESRFMLYEGSVSFVALMQQADVSVRATNTDGDAVSVRESLFLGIPVVASDCVSRPDGAILHRTRDLDSLTKSISVALKMDRKRENLAVADDCTTTLQRVYKTI